MIRFVTKFEIINPKSTYFGMVATFQRDCGEFYRLELIVTDSLGRTGPMAWHFYPAELRQIN